MKSNTKKIAVLAILLALCIVGANVKIAGSIALDSFPAFIGATVLGPFAGAFLGFFGHMMSALLAGFPNTLPVHLIIGGLMAVCLFVYGGLRHYWKKPSAIVNITSMVLAYLINVPLDLLVLYPILGNVVFGLFFPLSLAAIVNLGLAEVVALALPERYKKMFSVRT